MQFISKISPAYLTFFTDVEEHEFPSNCTETWGKIFLCSHLSFIAADSLKSEKDWPVDFAKSSLTVFTTICPKEQQTSDNLIVKDYCFITEIFDKFSFSDILRGRLSHLNEA